MLIARIAFRRDCCTFFFDRVAHLLSGRESNIDDSIYTRIFEGNEQVVNLGYSVILRFLFQSNQLDERRNEST